MHLSNIILLGLGVFFLAAGGIVFKYNMHRKSARFNHKTPSGGLFIGFMIISGALLLYYGATFQSPAPSPSERLINLKKEKLSTRGGESNKAQVEFLKKISGSL